MGNGGTLYKEFYLIEWDGNSGFMVTILRARESMTTSYNFRAIMFTNDQRKFCVHVFDQGEALVRLHGSKGRPELIWVQNMDYAETRRIVHVVGVLREHLLDGWKDFMATPRDSRIDEALERGRIASLHEPRAASARYDGNDCVVVELTNGCTFAFPARLAQGLEAATAEQLAQVEILGTGYGLHWEALNVDLSVPGLLAGLFGTKTHMARLAGRAKSPVKAAAARANGAKGGRPRKAAPG